VAVAPVVAPALDGWHTYTNTRIYIYIYIYICIYLKPSLSQECRLPVKYLITLCGTATHSQHVYAMCDTKWVSKCACVWVCSPFGRLLWVCVCGNMAIAKCWRWVRYTRVTLVYISASVDVSMPYLLHVYIVDCKCVSLFVAFAQFTLLFICPTDGAMPVK